MNQIQLYYNSQTVVFDVTLGNGSNGSITIEPNHALYDSNGYIRQFSLEYDDGVVGNFKLLPNNSTIDKILEFTESYLAPFGLVLLSQKIFSGKHPVNNVAGFLALKQTNPIVHNIFQYISINNSSYFEMTTHEHFITHPLKLTVN